LIFGIGRRCYLARDVAACRHLGHDGPAGEPAQSFPMATRERQTFGNHTVANQPPPLADYNVFEADTVLVEAVDREGADWAK
jgi:hypothetical protein